MASDPPSRSRTLLFLSFRDSRARSTTRFGRSIRTYADDNDNDADDDDDERAGLIRGSNNNNGAGASGSRSPHVALDVDATLPPKWVDIADQVEEVLAGLAGKMAALDRLHAKHVLPGFADRSAEEREIEASTTDITRDFRQCQTLIQRIALVAGTGGAGTHAFPPGARKSAADARAAQNVQRALAAKVQAASSAFRKKQRVYLEQLQGHAIKNQDLLVASGAVSLRGSDGLSAADDDVAVAGESMTITQTQMQAPPDVRSRAREIDHIATSIGELAGLFRDLGTLVIDQGTLLDSVEYNIELAATEVKVAAHELKVAEKYQKNTGRRKCIFLLLLIIFGLIVVLIFKPRRHHGSAGAPLKTSVAPSSGTSPSSSPLATAATPFRPRGARDWGRWDG